LTPSYTPNVTLTASPNLVAPNSLTAPNTNSSSIIATVRDGSPQNNLVQGVPVAFTISADPSGGSISPQVVVTQANGQAVATYYPGSGTTPANGVIIKAQVQGAVTPTAASVQLTVSGTSLFVTLGTGNTINVVSDTTYSQDWSVFVTDSNGNPVANANVTGQLTALLYTKGQMVFQANWTVGPPAYSGSIPNTSLPTDGYNLSQSSTGPWCPNTDPTGLGVWSISDPIQILYPPGNASAGQDYPHVMPGIPGNVTSTGVTNSSGYAGITVTYPKDHAYWTYVQLTVNAATNGTQSTTSAKFPLLGVSADYGNQSTLPPGYTSPYGVNACGLAF
jgi:hypothetical protein